MTLVPKQLLARMEIGDGGRRDADGSVRGRRFSPPNILMFGPFLRLPAGRYHLRLDCRVGQPDAADEPVLGLEVIAQDRIQQGWRDYLATELADGSALLDFEVPWSLSTEGGADVPFEFKVFHFGNARLSITAVTLDRIADTGDWQPPVRLWRLRGRLHHRWLKLHIPGSRALRHFLPSRLLSDRCSPHLFLPAGRYQLTLRGRSEGKSTQPVLAVEVRTRDRVSRASATFTADDLIGSGGTLTFDVVDDAAIESNAKLRFEVRLTRVSFARVSLEAADLRLLPEAMRTGSLPRSGAAPKTRTNVIVIGNCQAGLVAAGFRANEELNAKFRAVHHEARLQANVFEESKRDLASCDLLLVQDTQEWQRYPLRDYVPESASIISFPCLRFASLWPFDSNNGLDDRHARTHDLPNYEFTYFDGLLGRMRDRISDHRERLAAYRKLDFEGVIDCRTLHRFEERRLLGIDQKFGGNIGAFVLENFRKRRLFHTTGHPNSELFVTMLRQITRELGLNIRVRNMGCLDALRQMQIPVHPLVGRLLDVKWVGENTKYLYRGKELTWEDYFSEYISYYG